MTKINNLHYLGDYIPININREVKFRLTDYGKEIVKEKQGCLKHIKYNEYECHLWKFMSIFGDHMYMGDKQVIEDNLMYLETKEQIFNDL